MRLKSNLQYVSRCWTSGDYDHCTFNSIGEGTLEEMKTQTFVGKQGEIHKEKEIKVEAIFHLISRENFAAMIKNTHTKK